MITKIACKTCNSEYVKVGVTILCKKCDCEKYAWLVKKAYKKNKI